MYGVALALGNNNKNLKFIFFSEFVKNLWCHQKLASFPYYPSTILTIYLSQVNSTNIPQPHSRFNPLSTKRYPTNTTNNNNSFHLFIVQRQQK